MRTTRNTQESLEDILDLIDEWMAKGQMTIDDCTAELLADAKSAATRGKGLFDYRAMRRAKRAQEQRDDAAIDAAIDRECG